MKKTIPHIFKRMLPVIIFTGVFLCVHNVKAATITWDGSASTAWNNAANWVGDVVPTATDDVVINGSYTNAPTLDLASGAVTINSLSIGSSATSVLTVSNGDIDTKKIIVTNNVTVGGSGTLTHTANTSAQTHRLSLQVGGDVTVASGGSINLNGKGYGGRLGSGYGPGGGTAGSSSQGGNGGSYGGAGAVGYNNPNASSNTYGSVKQPVDLGSAGGSGNNNGSGWSGGGAVKLLVTGGVTINGTISATGSSGANEGGGSGGSIWIEANSIGGSGSIVANGGTSDIVYPGGAGAGGRISLAYSSRSLTNISARGGNAGNGYGGAGTIFFMSDGAVNGDLIVDNGGLSGPTTSQVAGVSETFDNLTAKNAGKYNIPAGSTTIVTSTLGAASSGYLYNNGALVLPTDTTVTGYTFYNNGSLTGVENLTIGSATNFEFWNLNPSTAFSLNNLTVLNGGTLSHRANSSTQAYTLNLNIAGNFDLQSGGKIDVNGRGYVGRVGSGYGPGGGAAAGSSQGGNGGSYGGVGGSGYNNPNAKTAAYGSVVQPSDIGSAGGSGSSGGPVGSSGGGAVRLNVAGDFILSGTIVANGNSTNSAGGGSGGGVWITAGIFSGAGSISAIGGNSSIAYTGGGGGGGRVAIEYVTNTFAGTVSVNGGSGHQSGGVGTIRRGSLFAETVSSVYNSESVENRMVNIRWAESLPTGTDARFQLRSAPDNSGSPGTWTSWMGPDSTNGTYFTDPAGGEILPAVLTDGINDQWMQYKIILTSPDLSVNPVVFDVTMTYVVNVPPMFDSTFGTNGVSVSQISDNESANWGKLQIEYAAKDEDISSGTVTQNYVTPAFEYSLDGSNWNMINLANISFQAPGSGDVADVNGDGKLDNKMLEGSYLTYRAFWNAKAEIPGTDVASMQIRVTLNDNEIANNLTAAIGNTASLDVKNPTLAAVPMRVQANSVPAVISSDVADSNALQMKIGLANDLTDANWENYNATKNLALATNPDTVYAQYRDAFGNTSAVLSAQTPEQPSVMMIQDTSNLYGGLNEYRLFVAWKTVASPLVGFGSYYIYRSENQNDWTQVGTVNDRLTNYYGDNSVQGNANYYYRVATTDSEGNISYVSSIVNGVANGIKDAGEGGGGSGEQPPVISNVTVENITPTSAQVNWTTDMIATSTVGFSTQAANFENEVGSGSVVTSHSVTINGLTPGTQYYFQAKSANAANALAVDTNGGNGYTFTTSTGDSVAPTITEVVVTNTTASTATITWTTDEAATSFVEYSKTDGFSVGAQYGDASLVTTHNITVPSLEQGTTYYFKVRSKDAANNERVSAQGDFTTLVSGDVTAPEISNLSTTASFNSATISWTTNEDATSYVEYGLTDSYGRIYGDNNPVQTHTVQLPFDLSSEQTYHYRVRSIDGSHNEAVSADNTFVTTVNPADSVAPVIANINIGTPTRDSVTVTWNTNEAATSYVGYSADGGNTFLEQGFSSLSAFHSVTLAGLTPGTVYLLKISSADASGNLAIDDNGASYYQRSTAPGPVPPVITSISSLNLDSSSTTVSWDTDLFADSFVEYGLDTNYGQIFGKYEDVKNHAITLKSLLPGTTYHFRVRSAEEVENVSGDYTFTTINAPDVDGPQISAISSSNITKDGARVTWATEENSNSLVYYGLSSAYAMLNGNRIEMVTDHAVDLDKLEPETTYHYQVNSVDTLGNPSFSSDQIFTTIADTSSPEISDLEVLGVLQGGVIISWKTDKRASTVIHYGTSHDLGNSFDAQIVSDMHTISLAGLEDGQTYYFKAISEDEYGNSVESAEQSFTTETDPSLNHEPLSAINEISTTFLTDTKAVISFKTDQAAQCFVEYGIQTDNYTEVPVGESTFETEHAIHIAGLVFATPYFYQLTCQDNLDTIISSEEKTFTTLEKQVGESQIEQSDRTAPIISNMRVTSVGSENAVIEWDTDEDASSLVRIGTTNSYGKMIGNDGVSSNSASYIKKHSVNLERLVPGTRYYYVTMSLDKSGNIGQSSQGTFTTSGTSNISSVVVESTEIGKATIAWFTEVPTSTILEYGVSTKYGSVAEDSNLTQNHQVTLSNLKAGSVYHFLIKGEDDNNNLYVSADTTFEPKSPPKIKDIQALHITEHSATIEFTTNVPTSAAVTFQDSRKDNAAQTKGHPDLVTKHSIELTDLVSGLVFMYTVSVRDENGTEVVSEQKSFTTGKDTVEPLIDQVKTDTALTQNDKVQAIISWKTDEPAMTYLTYRKGKDGEEKEIPVSEILAQQHVSVITAFDAGTVYYFKVKAIDAADNESVSNEFALLTPRRKENIVQVIITNFYDIFRWAKR